MLSPVEKLAQHPDDGVAVLLNGYNIAQLAARRGNHRCNYRQFQVAAASLVRLSSGELAVVTGVNVMPSPSGKNSREEFKGKVCAEKMQDGKFRKIMADGKALKELAKFIVSVPQFDDTSRVSTNTLPPCRICRPMLRDACYMSDDTPIITVGRNIGEFSLPEKPIYEITTRRELLAIHQVEGKQRDARAIDPQYPLSPELPLEGWADLASSLAEQRTANEGLRELSPLVAMRTVLFDRVAVAA